MSEERQAFLNALETVEGKTVKIVAPYSFIPLTKPLPSAFGDEAQPSHGRPLPDGVCGRMIVEWCFDLPVLVGSGEEDADKAQVFATAPDGRPAIPGGTIRGLLRSVIEIASGSRFDLTDRDAHFAVRDMNDKWRWKPFSPVTTGRAMSFGWLKRKDPKKPFGERDYDGWVLEPVESAYQFDTADYLKAVSGTPGMSLVGFEALTVKKKYDEIKKWRGPLVNFRIEDRPGASRFEEKKKAVFDAAGANSGWLVLTGIDPNRTNTGGGAPYPKLYATVFQAAKGSDVLDIPSDLMRRFVRVHATTPGAEDEGGARGAWDFWFGAYAKAYGKEKGGANTAAETGDAPMPRAADGTPMPGIPVFIGHTVPTRVLHGQNRNAFDPRNDHAERTKALRQKLSNAATAKPEDLEPEDLYFSLARLVKVPYRYGPGEILERQGHGLDGRLDFARALFGQVPPEKLADEIREKPGRGALKGRVFCGEASLETPAPADEAHIAVTMAPRPSFWPYYLAPGPDGDPEKPYDYSDPKAEVAGWKRYPVRSRTVQFQRDNRPDHAAGRTENPTYRARTESRLRFLQASPQKPLVFSGEIRFHNLKPAELGALLWAITWGASDGQGLAPAARPPQRHLIGRGKAQGFGRSYGVVRDLKIETNLGGAAEAASAYVKAFTDHVAEAYAAATAGAAPAAATFAALPMVARLLALADPGVAAGRPGVPESLEGRLVYPTHPFGAAQTGEASPSLEGYRLVKAAARKDEKRRQRLLPLYPLTRD